MKTGSTNYISEKTVNNLFKKIPKIDTFVNDELFKELNKELLTNIARKKIDKLRQKIKEKAIKDFSIEELKQDIKKEYQKEVSPSLKPLINATGVILHTNMGRSLISNEILQKAGDIITSYSNLEYNQNEGKRGERYSHITKDLQTLLGVESALVVNNNASAVFLILNTFAKDKEVIVSRGELVEIGGSFRVPEVMKASGAKLKEVGTTNKTKLSDYKNAISDNTAMLLKVHKSNFDIVGFSEEVSFKEISYLAKTHNLLDYYDLGSAYIPELPYNLGQKEPPLKKILDYKPSLVSFSGDKLFGSVQAGIIIGKKEYIDKLKQNQLLRMLRVDKVTLSILQESIRAYIFKEYEKIPTLKLLFTDIKTLKTRAENLKKALKNGICEVVESKTYMGGGTLPNRTFPTIALAFKGNAIELEKKFRSLNLIGRIENDRFLIDFRSILPELDEQILAIAKIALEEDRSKGVKDKVK